MLFAKKFRVEYTQMYPGKDNRLGVSQSSSRVLGSKQELTKKQFQFISNSTSLPLKAWRPPVGQTGVLQSTFPPVIKVNSGAYRSILNHVFFQTF